MAASCADYRETCALQGPHKILPSGPGERAHAATVTRWIPTNSIWLGSWPSTSRQSTIASRISTISSSSEVASVWHPGNWGTEATYTPSSSLSITTSNWRTMLQVYANKIIIADVEQYWGRPAFPPSCVCGGCHHLRQTTLHNPLPAATIKEDVWHRRVSLSSPPSSPKTVLERMTSAIRHRGPDDFGFFTSDQYGVYLGHRRLSIVDVAGGHQPIPNEDGSRHIVFNGEIFNHAAIRAGTGTGRACL